MNKIYEKEISEKYKEKIANLNMRILLEKMIEKNVK